LKQIGFSRVVVGTAKEAINSLRKQKFDLMFLDLQLPDAPGDQVFTFPISPPMPNSKRPRNWNVSAQHTTATKSQGRINVLRKDLNMCCTSIEVWS
jgi:hypothetical protein